MTIISCIDFGKLVLAVFSLSMLGLDKTNNPARKIVVLILLLVISPQLILSIGLPGLLFITPLQHWTFFLGPLLHYYQQVSAKRLIKKSMLFHFLAGILWYIVTIVFFRDGYLPSGLNPLYGLSSLLSLGGYSIFVLSNIREHNKTLKNQVSYRDFYMEFEWLKYIMISLLLITIAVGILIPMTRILLVGNTNPEQIYNMVELPEPAAFLHSVAALLFVFFFSLFSLKQNRITTPDIPIPDEIPQADFPSQNDEKSYEKIVSYMNESKIYLENEMNLQYLCDKIGMKRNDVSRIINVVSGENFFHFVNMFRAREFQSAMEEKRYPEYTLLAVGLECGFKSQATFYEAVKREFSLTPSKLAKQIPQKS